MQVDVRILQEYLASLDIESTLIPAGGQAVVDELEVPIGVDAENRERRVIIMADNPFKDEDASSKEEQDAVVILKYIGILPITVSPSLLGDLARLVCFLNHVSDIPGFLVSEPLASVYFLYSLPCPNGQIDPVQFVTILGLVSTQIDEFQPFIEQVAKGELSIDKVLSGEVEL